MSSNDLITVGRLGRPRGTNGEMFITPVTDFPDRFVGLKQILVRQKDGWQMMEIELARIVSGRPAIKFVNVSTPEDAARLTNRELAVKRSETVELPDDMFYHFDLIGCKVYDTSDGEEIGEIVDVESYPANDVYLIKMDADKLVRLPAVREFVKSVNVKNLRVEIDQAGLIE
ncbi:MAG: ribosome maturation factor RimM [bacterium]|nr:ribosome maturation factor RimM [bacterium]